MTSRKILITIVIACIIFASSISVYVVYFFKPDVTHIVSQTVDTTSGKKIMVLSTESSIQSTTPGLVDLSLKGYLTTPDNIGISNKIVQISLKGIQIDGNQTKEENIVIGNSTTDQNGCFYFNNWNNEILNNTLMEIPKSYNMVNGLMNETPQQTLHQANLNNVLWLATNFTGDNEFLPSSNITKIRFSPFMPIIERPAIGIHLTNNTSLVQDMYLKRGQSYDFEALVWRGNALSGPEYKLLKLDIKGLPCGVTSTFENSMANLTEQYNATTHLKISVDENTKTGEYY
ncbi:MAG: hypothetical protein ACREAN_09055, partial [Nitrosopumilaceae archaeon]